ncbi:Cell wall protein PRY3 [Termitomyces sp. T112]|nr:Cell wall protein PRY3 [Termitomyces sp. T112]
MTRLVSFVSVVLLIASLPDVLAGPACYKKHYKHPDCLSKCNNRWGWSGRTMGNDRWGPVIKKNPSNETLDDVLHKACGFEPSSTATYTHQHTGNTETGRHHVFPTSIKSSTIFTSSPAPPKTSSTLPSRSPTASSVHRTTAAQTAAPTTTASSSGGTSSGSSATSSSDIDAYLSAHNTVRAQHGAAPLTWSNDLASKAQTWANKCVFQHSGGSLGPYGENLAAGTGSSYGIQAAIKSWTDEASQYNPSHPTYSHFTQVVWKGTTQLGCAVQLCDGMFSASFGKAKFYVCEYSPAGNIIGEFAQNVQA